MTKMIFANDLCILTSIHRIKNLILLNVVIAGVQAKSPIKHCVHVSIIPLFPAVPNFCRVHVCSQKFHVLLWSPGRRKSLSKGLKEKIVALDRGWEKFPTLRKALFIKKLRQSWTVFLLKNGEIYKFGREAAFIKPSLNSVKLFSCFLFFFLMVNFHAQSHFPIC